MGPASAAIEGTIRRGSSLHRTAAADTAIAGCTGALSGRTELPTEQNRADESCSYKVTKGLLDRFGEKRVIDSPITESGFAGLTVGAALAGLHPVVSSTDTPQPQPQPQPHHCCSHR
jgi:translation initiation factor 2 gamma subunit (eIF-2gamma)